MNMKTVLALVLMLGASAFGQTRQIQLNWTASTSTGVTGTIVLMSPTPTGTFVQIGCVGIVAGSTCVSGSTAATTTYTDTEPTRASYSYQVVAVAATCTPTTPTGTSCGNSPPSNTTTTTVPPRPLPPGTPTVTVN